MHNVVFILMLSWPLKWIGDIIKLKITPHIKIQIFIHWNLIWNAQSAFYEVITTYIIDIKSTNKTNKIFRSLPKISSSRLWGVVVEINIQLFPVISWIFLLARGKKRKYPQVNTFIILILFTQSNICIIKIQ